jgi:two-component sensor histidine kinase
MDIQLPVLDGYEATRRIKTDPNLKATPVIAVSSFAMKGDEDALRSAAARVLAIAAVHERLYTGEDASVVRLDTFLSDLCGEIGRACGCPDGITTDVQRVDVPTDMAIPLALIVNELVTNVVKHVGPPCGISLRSEGGNALKLTISDTGQGPRKNQPRPGLGTRIVDAFSTQLAANVETKRVSEGYTIELTVPLAPTQR